MGTARVDVNVDSGFSLSQWAVRLDPNLDRLAPTQIKQIEPFHFEGVGVASGRAALSDPVSGARGKMPQRCIRDAVERQDLRGATEFDRDLRHSEHHTTGLVLRDGRGAGFPHSQEPFRAIAPHPRQQDSDDIAELQVRDRTEHDVHGGTLVMYPGTGPYDRPQHTIGPAKQHVKVARSHQRPARSHDVAILCLFHLHPAERVQAGSKGSRKDGGDVLCNYDRRARSGHGEQNRLNGLRSSRRGSDC